MNNCLFRNGSLLVRISLVRYKYVSIYMYICYGYVLDTYPFMSSLIKNSLRVHI